jgi:hypothetical protein
MLHCVINYLSLHCSHFLTKSTISLTSCHRTNFDDTSISMGDSSELPGSTLLCRDIFWCFMIRHAVLLHDMLWRVTMDDIVLLWGAIPFPAHQLSDYDQWFWEFATFTIFADLFDNRISSCLGVEPSSALRQSTYMITSVPTGLIYIDIISLCCNIFLAIPSHFQNSSSFLKIHWFQSWTSDIRPYPPYFTSFDLFYLNSSHKLRNDPQGHCSRFFRMRM